VLLVVLAGLAYAGLVWYPQRAAAELIRPSSEEFTGALDTYRSTISVFPPGPTDPQALIAASNQFIADVGPAREDLGRASAQLEQREPVDWPVISGRPPLDQASETRNRMLDFYTSSLETLASAEGVAGYVVTVGAVLPQLDNLEQALGSPTPAEVPAAVAAATPIADQVLADLRTITPPREMGGLHASLLVIAQQIRQDLDDIARAGEQGSEPLTRARVQDVRSEIASFRENVGAAPRDAATAGLEDRKAEVDRLAAETTAGLEALRSDYGITGVAVPAPAPTAGA
jgi:hypothetical protein